MSGAGGRLSSPAPASERSPARESNLALTVSDLGKCYRIYARPADRLRQAIFGRLGRSYYVEKWALRDVSFELERGAAMGIVGRNGAGKSTLLQIIAGTLAPTTGRVIAAGRVVALLELWSGFNPEFTGRENVFLYGALYGLTRAEMESRFDPIAAFADIGAYMDLPLKTYSSGMGVRLAFAVIAHLDPDILIVDEALSVGDVFFQHRCMRHISRLIASGTTLLFVSHAPDVVKRLCRRALWLQDGRSAAFGDSASVVERYLADVRMALVPAPASATSPGSTVAPVVVPDANCVPLRDRPKPDPALVCQGACELREFFCDDLTHPALAIPGPGAMIGFRTRARQIEIVLAAHPFGGIASLVADRIPHHVNLHAPAPRLVRVPLALPASTGDHAIFITSIGADPKAAGQEVWFLDGVIAEDSARLPIKRSAAFDRRAADGRYGTGDATITFVELLHPDEGRALDEVESGATVVLRIHMDIYAPCSQLDVSFIVRDRNGIDLFGTTALERGVSIPGTIGARLVDFTFANRLGPGSYSVLVALVARETDATAMTPLDVVPIATVFRVPFDPSCPIWYLFDESVQVTTQASEPAEETAADSRCNEA